MKLTCMGTADALGTGGRHCAGYKLEAEGGLMLLEAGPSLLTTLKADGTDMRAIDGVAVSHLHGDHFAGLPFLLLEYEHGTPRERPLRVIGPPGTEEVVRGLLDLLYREHPNRQFSYPVLFEEITAHKETEVGPFRIESFGVPHQEVDLSLGYRVRGAGRHLVFSGDTPWTPDLLRAAEGADLFLCECTDFEHSSGRHIRFADWERHRASFDCGEILLTHLGPEVQARLAEIPDATARDGLQVPLGAGALQSAGRR